MIDQLDRDVRQVLSDIVARQPPPPHLSTSHTGSSAVAANDDHVDARSGSADIAVAMPSTRRWQVRPLTIAAALLAIAGIAATVIAVRASDGTNSAEPLPRFSAAAWTPVPDPAGVFQAADHIDRVTNGDSVASANSSITISQIIHVTAGLLAVGTIAVGFQQHGGIWTSPDGTSWTAIDGGPPFDSARVEGAVETYGTSISGVTFQNGQFVAVGYSAADGTFTPQSWVSRDGTTWTMNPLPLTGSDQASPQTRPHPTVMGVISTPTGFLAYGSDGADPEYGTANTPLLWHSSDGIDWTATTAAGLTQRGNQLAGITSAHEELIAFGSTGSYSANHATIWRSTDDGSTWTAITPAADDALATSEIRFVIASGNDLLAFGNAMYPESLSEAMPGTEVTAVGPDTDRPGDPDVIAWRSMDGLSWQPLDITGVNTSDFETVVAATDGPAGVLIAINRSGPSGYNNLIVHTGNAQSLDPVDIAGQLRIFALVGVDDGYLAAVAEIDDGLATGTPPPATAATEPIAGNSAQLWHLAIG